jgi:hypothetical protein
MPCGAAASRGAQATETRTPWIPPGSIYTIKYDTYKRSFAEVAKGHKSLQPGRRHKRRAGGLGPARPARAHLAAPEVRAVIGEDIVNSAYRALIRPAQV